MRKPRKSDFKIGCYHGRVVSGDDKRECKMQRDLFLIGRAKLIFSKVRTIAIRFFAYEVPLEEGVNRGRCIDLLAYDDHFNIYVFELKRKDGECLEEAIKQIEGYSEEIIKKLPRIEKEFNDNYFFKNIHFEKKSVRKVILAPKSYYPESKKNYDRIHAPADVFFGYFGGIKDGNEMKLLENRIDCVNIHNFKRLQNEYNNPSWYA